MASLADIRAGIASKITTSIPGVQCSGYVLSSPTSPFFDVELGPDGIEYDQSAGNGVMKFSLLIRGCIVGLDIGQQKRLDEWTAPAGDGSLKAALETDPTLGGVASAVHVAKASGYRLTQVAGANNSYLGAEWDVEVFTEQ